MRFERRFHERLETLAARLAETGVPRDRRHTALPLPEDSPRRDNSRWGGPARSGWVD